MKEPTPDEQLPDEQLLEELSPALDAWTPPGARVAFREGAHARFVAGELTEALETFTPRPRDEFRAGLRDAFLAGGAAGSDEAAELPELPSRAVRTDRPPALQRAPRAARATRTRFRLLVGGGLASVAAAAAIVLWLLQPGAMSWRVEAQGFSAAGILVDGVALAEDASPAELERLLDGAQSLRSGTQALRMVLGGDVAVVELGPGSEVDLSGVPEARDEDIHFAGDEGAFRIATGGGYRRESQRLTFRAHDVTVQVTGTVFGVDLYGDDVCVCCCQGTVRVQAPGVEGPGTEDEVHESFLAAGETRYVHADGRSSFVEDLEDHQAPLRALGEFARTLP